MVVTFGEIMLRLSTPGYQRFVQANEFEVNYGGGEANVAVSIANYGMAVSFVTRLPNNPIADSAIAHLKKYGTDTRHIVRGGERVGIYFLETGAVNRASKVVYDRSHSSIADITAGMINWKEAFKGATWFHWTGITPAISQGAAEACLEAVKEARKAGLTISTDLNYRKNLWRYGKTATEIMPELVSFCDVILGNEEDAEMVFGIKPAGTDVTKGHVEADAYISVADQLFKKFPNANKVIITLRGSVNANHNTWSGTLFTREGAQYKAPQYNITHIVDRVGGGDSFMGGLIFGLLHYKNDQKALNFAVAASCLKHTIPGDFNLVSVEEVEKLMEGDTSGRVSR
ncbi:MAG: sugar kinase [Bacteroidales bacterium]|nr:sugar kinase [Bacteroidales bacterium]